MGVSHACDYPLGVASLARLTAPSSGNAGEGARPDREMVMVQAGLSFYRLNVDLLRALQPDLIVTQDRAAGCGIPYAELLEATRRVLGRVSLTAWKPSLVCSILTFSGNSYRRKESYTAMSPLEKSSCARVVAWVLPTLLCSAHAWAAIIAFRVRTDCSVYCGGKAWKQKTS